MPGGHARASPTRPVRGPSSLALPQDIQSHAFDFPVAFFADTDLADPPARSRTPSRWERSPSLLAGAERPLIIAGGGVIYSGATPELERLASQAGIPVAETFAGKGAVQSRAWWQLGGIGLEGHPAANRLARQADVVLTVGSRLTDFATASQSLFQDPGVRFASINLDARDADRLGALSILADAKLALGALADALGASGATAGAAWRELVQDRVGVLGPASPPGHRPRQPL